MMMMMMMMVMVVEMRTMSSNIGIRGPPCRHPLFAFSSETSEFGYCTQPIIIIFIVIIVSTIFIVVITIIVFEKLLVDEEMQAMMKYQKDGLTSFEDVEQKYATKV